MELGYVKKTFENQILTIEFYHPSHNSLPANLLEKLRNAFDEASNDKEINLIILKSGGDRTFCAGASFDELLKIENAQQGKNFFMGFSQVINSMRKCKKIILGRVQGKAVGGGIGLAAAVDYCMASKYASVRLSELAIGIGPFVIGPAVKRKIGLSAFSHLALNAGEWQTAKWAQQKGLFCDVFESTEQLDAYVKHFSEKLAKMNPEALTNLKTIFWEGHEDWEELMEKRAEWSGKLVLSKFTMDAITEFKNKA